MFTHNPNPSLSRQSLLSMENNMIFVSDALEQATALDKLSTQVAAEDLAERGDEVRMYQTSFECMCEQAGLTPPEPAPVGQTVSMESLTNFRDSVKTGFKRMLQALALAMRSMGKWFRSIFQKADPRIHALRKDLAKAKKEINDSDVSSRQYTIAETLSHEIVGDVVSGDVMMGKLGSLSSLITIDDYIGKINPQQVQDVRDTILLVLRGKSGFKVEDLVLGPVVSGDTVSKAEVEDEDWDNGSRYIYATKLGSTLIVQETQSSGARMVKALRVKDKSDKGAQIKMEVSRDQILKAIGVATELLDYADQMNRTISRLADVAELLEREVDKAAKSDDAKLDINHLRLIHREAQDSQLGPVVAMKALIRTSAAISHLANVHSNAAGKETKK